LDANIGSRYEIHITSKHICVGSYLDEPIEKNLNIALLHLRFCLIGSSKSNPNQNVQPHCLFHNNSLVIFLNEG